MWAFEYEFGDWVAVQRVSQVAQHFPEILAAQLLQRRAVGCQTTKASGPTCLVTCHNMPSVSGTRGSNPAGVKIPDSGRKLDTRLVGGPRNRPQASENRKKRPLVQSMAKVSDPPTKGILWQAARLVGPLVEWSSSPVDRDERSEIGYLAGTPTVARMVSECVHNIFVRGGTLFMGPNLLPRVGVRAPPKVGARSQDEPGVGAQSQLGLF